MALAPKSLAPSSHETGGASTAGTAIDIDCGAKRRRRDGTSPAGLQGLCADGRWRGEFYRCRLLKWRPSLYRPASGGRIYGSLFFRRSCKGQLGRSQAVRQRILIPPFGGSIPPAPARFFAQRQLAPDRIGRTWPWSLAFGASGAARSPMKTAAFPARPPIQA